MNNNTALNVLIVDDEPLVTYFIKRIVKNAGDRVVTTCYDSDSALQAIKTTKPDLIFMDINIKGNLDGISVIRKAADKQATVFYISAYTSDEIIQDALDTNPYNYLFKPLEEKDIKLALQLCRKKLSVPHPQASSQTVQLSDKVNYDAKLGQLLLNGSTVTLTQTEKKLLDLFVKNINIVLDTDILRESLWGEKSVADSTLRDHISKLRQKVPELDIQNNFGMGYILKQT